MRLHLIHEREWMDQLTGRQSATASTGCWKGHEKWCLHKAFITTFSRYCSWLVTRPGLFVFVTSGGGGFPLVAGQDIVSSKGKVGEGRPKVCLVVTLCSSHAHAFLDKKWRAVSSKLLASLWVENKKAVTGHTTAWVRTFTVLPSKSLLKWQISKS